MRLVCPRCGAEYEIDDRLIPAGGREVECSSCGNTWFQAGRLRMPAPAAAAAAARAAEPGAARMGRPIPEDVMAILRDEAAHFRASHPGIEAALPADTAPQDPDAVGDVGGDAPATAPSSTGGGVAEDGPAGGGEGPAPDAAPDSPAGKVTATPGPESGAGIAAPDAGDGLSEEKAGTAAGPDAGAGAVARPDGGRVPEGNGEAVAPAPQGPGPAPAAEASQRRDETGRYSRPLRAKATPPHEEPRPAGGGGFGKGFLIGLLIAALFLGLYMAAPHAGEGMPSDALRAIRAAGDAFHQWVQAQLAGLW